MTASDSCSAHRAMCSIRRESSLRGTLEYGGTGLSYENDRLGMSSAMSAREGGRGALDARDEDAAGAEFGEGLSNVTKSIAWHAPIFHGFRPHNFLRRIARCILSRENSSLTDFLSQSCELTRQAQIEKNGSSTYVLDSTR
ncbi:unnamed protein product [Agarophyton chilense]